LKFTILEDKSDDEGKEKINNLLQSNTMKNLNVSFSQDIN